MKNRTKSSDWGYLLIVIAGFLFVITAISYMMLMMRQQEIGPEGTSAVANHPLLLFLDQYGLGLLVGELIVLAVVTIGVIWRDDLRRRRGPAKSKIALSGDTAENKSTTPDLQERDHENHEL